MLDLRSKSMIRYTPSVDVGFGDVGLHGFWKQPRYPDAPWCWKIDLQNWAISKGSMLVNVPAPWSIWDTEKSKSGKLGMWQIYVNITNKHPGICVRYLFQGLL